MKNKIKLIGLAAAIALLPMKQFAGTVVTKGKPHFAAKAKPHAKAKPKESMLPHPPPPKTIPIDPRKRLAPNTPPPFVHRP